MKDNDDGRLVMLDCVSRRRSLIIGGMLLQMMKWVAHETKLLGSIRFLTLSSNHQARHSHTIILLLHTFDVPLNQPQTTATAAASASTIILLHSSLPA